MHAYTIAGDARHFQPTKSKSAKKKKRPTTLKDIEDQGLFPSVTEYCRVLSAPGLEEWKMQKVVEACFEDTPSAGEDLSNYKQRILKKSGEESSDAADLGTRIHASIESYLTNQETWNGNEAFIMPDGTQTEAWEFVLPVVSKLNDLGIVTEQSERVVVNPPYGYAGTVDLIGKREGDISTIVDFKSKKTKAGVLVEAQETHPMQIAAYMAAYLKNDWIQLAEGYNIYISTTEIGRVEHVHYTHDQLMEAWRAFKHCLSLWEWRTGYSAAVK